MAANFITLCFLRPKAISATKTDTAAQKMPSIHRSHSDPMLLPEMNAEWSDAQARPVNPYRPSPQAPKNGDMVLISALLLDHKITNMEERLKTAMGPWALYGLRYSTLVGLTSATVIKLALVVMAGLLPLPPVVGFGIFLGVLVGSIAVGVIMQTVALRKFIQRGQSGAFLQEIKAQQDELESQGQLSGIQIKSLRRLQIMQADIEGGIKHSLWSIVYGISGFDPELTRMMRKAHDAVLPVQVEFDAKVKPFAHFR